jgi:hypothetical protein
VTNRRRCSVAAWVVTLTALTTSSAAGQTSRFTLDAVVAADGVKGSTPRREVGTWIDIFGAVRITDGLDVVARPIVSRRPFDGAWQRQIYHLGARYERRPSRDSGMGFRVEAGQLPSPIGLALLENRPDLNPVISQHSAYYVALPRVDPEIPRTFLIAAAYPLGSQLTVATRGWDARVALTDSSPVRGRPFFGANKPPRLANIVAGFGVTPRVGLRLGVAAAHGPYVASRELRDPSRGDRHATMWQVEGDWAFGYTRIAGEFVHSSLETARANAVASGGWIEIMQTVRPRLFVAGRADSQHFDYQRPSANSLERQHYERFEAIAGFRITPDVTLRGGYMVRSGYVVFHWDDQVLASVVWQKKIW